MNAYDIIIRPIITEQSMADVADKKYVFQVAIDANKTEIKLSGALACCLSFLSIGGFNLWASFNSLFTTRGWYAMISIWSQHPHVHHYPREASVLFLYRAMIYGAQGVILRRW